MPPPRKPRFQTFQRPKVRVAKISSKGKVYVDFKDVESLKKMLGPDHLWPIEEAPAVDLAGTVRDVRVLHHLGQWPVCGDFAHDVAHKRVHGS